MNKWYLVDASGYIFRAYHALPPMTRADGTVVNAVYGFSSMLLKLIQDYQGEGHILVCHDAARKNFRNDIYPEYKAHRPPAPEDLVPQFPLIREAVAAFGLPQIELEGFEADDLIATYARLYAERGDEVVIVSADKDLLQLLRPGVQLLDPMKNTLMGDEAAIKKFGVLPDKVIDVQALAGDSTDNIPGVPGIGVKTAAALIDEFGDLENLLQNAHTIKQNKRRESLIEFAEQARVSKKLVSLDVYAPVTLDVTDNHRPSTDELANFFQAQGFKSLLNRIGSVIESKPAKSHLEKDYELVTTEQQLQHWCERIHHNGFAAIDTETTGLDTMNCELVGISLAIEPGKACYIPIAHKSDGGMLEPAPEQLSLQTVQSYLQPLLNRSDLTFIGHNFKFDLKVLENAGFHILLSTAASRDISATAGMTQCRLEDTMLMSFAAYGSRHKHNMDDLVSRYLGETAVSYKEVTNKGKITFDYVPLKQACDYAAEDADYTLRLYHYFQQSLKEQQAHTVYYTLEQPLMPVLAEMEMAGIKVNPQRLQKLSAEFTADLQSFEEQIFTIAGHEFNIASPKQLGVVLFEELNLPVPKKSKTGGYATGVEILEPLSAEHKIAELVLEWRQIAKLRSTYSEALLKQIDRNTGRVHTNFTQAVTNTGRLSSNDPNLQNIPIRTESGKRIREAFIAKERFKLISIDYSQIELRILAAMANIPSLKEAFKNGEDIHAATAKTVFGVEQVSSDQRRQAKTINFGIIYGISAFGLAQRMGVSNYEAKEIIKTYFEKYPGIRKYMDSTIEQAKVDGFVTTLFGRKIYLDGINAKNPMQRSFSQRAAINAPIQGTAADIIRRAMIRVPDILKQSGLNATMLLQVHDELVFECAASETEKLVQIITPIMEEACLPFIDLGVKLSVEAGVGNNWAEAH